MSNLTETHKPATAGPHPGASKWASKLDYLLYQRTVLVLALLFFLGVVSILLHLPRLSSDLVESATLQNVTRYSEALAEFRALYTSEVVARVNVKKDGTPFWCSVHIVGLEHPEYGKTWIAVQEDITERKQTQLALLQSTRLVALGQMAAGMAHELSQPLTALSTTAEGVLLRQEEGMELAPERLQEMMRHMMGLVERMASIIQHLRTFSRDTSQEPDSSLAVNDIIQSALQLIQSQLQSDKIDLELDLDEKLPAVLGHSSSLEQVMLNLLTNGRDAMNQKEEDNDGEKRVSIRTCYDTKEERVLIEVEDQGTGIRTEDQSRLFDPFFTTKAPDKGTGLGLSLSYAIVKNHGGDIEWQSQEGVGALFRVCLPVAAKV
jgi:C4-dicarboxylate-specific signal transduction histidine kinase